MKGGVEKRMTTIGGKCGTRRRESSTDRTIYTDILAKINPFLGKVARIRIP